MMPHPRCMYGPVHDCKQLTSIGRGEHRCRPSENQELLIGLHLSINIFASSHALLLSVYRLLTHTFGLYSAFIYIP